MGGVYIGDVVTVLNDIDEKTREWRRVISWGMANVEDGDILNALDRVLASVRQMSGVADEAMDIIAYKIRK